MTPGFHLESRLRSANGGRMTPRDAALDLARQLTAAGHAALFAGGCVRDKLLDREPKDYDIATSAKPEEVLKLFLGGSATATEP